MQFNYFVVFGLTIFGFAIMYFGGAWIGMRLAIVGEPIVRRPIKPRQMRSEIKLSLISILIFGLLTVATAYLVNHGLLHVSWTVSWPKLLLEILALFLWNEIHFYISHRLLHTRWLFKHVHYKHHLSTIPTAYSTFSFHYVEALLLGSVLTTALLFYSFSVLSLLTLPLMSLILNVLGHCNLDFFPGRSAQSLLSFTPRHSDHHVRNNGNYGFFLPYFDQMFATSIKEQKSHKHSRHHQG
ncbi:desaturase [Paenibacillus baekrokdamisoli]|uniref:Desaturase n=1 Tax=Paenibacillus baekrokdamisoli TaxID=1712516 RepID=A0A3G9J9Q1_9BACL|nr:sterol desaturase family protein [Paenibacillus baekrokdamisoli]MBB3070054.1 sterol desaturase/sphingolipid hydroxylase (fatty acid hydroxylase superfamily) [Paenibacillus baekrokdamisoli]BBH20598.1 desaturase [Paenibacillus baekrokdamisoli]